MTARARRLWPALLVALALAGLALTARESAISRRSADFSIGYSAALLVRSGHPDAVYDQAALGALMVKIAPGIDPRLPFDQPAAALLPFIALSYLPLDLALRVWQVATVALFLLALYVLQRRLPLGRQAPALGLLALLAAVPAWAALAEGQLSALLLLGGALVVDAALGGSWPSAAVGLALVAVKPQYVPAYLLILVAARRARPVLAGLAGSVTVGLSSLLLGGTDGLIGLLRSVSLAGRVVPARLSESWAGIVTIGMPPALAAGVTLVPFAIACLVLGWLAWQRRPSPLGYAALAAGLAVLGSPHSLPHDLVLLAIPAWLGFAMARKGMLPWPVPALATVNLALIIDMLGATPFVLGPVVMSLVLVWYVREFRRRAARWLETGRAA